MLNLDFKPVEHKEVYLPDLVLDWHKQLFSFIHYVENVDEIDIATLGPAGTSSEASAKYLLSSIKNKPGKYRLFSSYEEAVNPVLEGYIKFLLVANAYERIDKIYMNPELNFLFSFMFQTPDYGLAKVENYELPKNRKLKIATHHAPSTLIPWFLVNEQIDYTLVLVNSTSEAAIMAQTKQVDLCITNATSARKYDVKFISRLRPIRMQWSIFNKLVDSADN